MAGFLEKPAILFAKFFDLGFTTLSNIATKLSFLEWRPPEVCVAQHKEAYPMSSAPLPPPTALPVAATVMAATTTATVTAAWVVTTTTAVGASTATTVAAAATATAVDTNNKQQSTKSGSGRLGGGGGGNTRTTATTTADGTMALIAATTLTAAAVATVAATTTEVWRRRGDVGCRQMVVARKSQNPFGDFTQQRGDMICSICYRREPFLMEASYHPKEVPLKKGSRGRLTLF
jgi:hypothetical protein